MLVLAMDSSAKSASVSVTQFDQAEQKKVLLGESFVNNNITHSQTLMMMTQDLLKNANISLSDIDRFAVTNGPGSFTGLRIGVCAIMGLCFAKGYNEEIILPVSSLEALAHNVNIYNGYVCAAMDARCNQVYTALYEFRKGRVVGNPIRQQATKIGDLIEKMRELNLNEDIFLVGDGAQLVKNQLQEEERFIVTNPNFNLIKASSIADIAIKADPMEFVSSLEVEINYLRLPQAQRDRLAQA